MAFHNHHPSVHAAWSQWSNEETLHVACAYANPFRWETRRRLLHNFRHHLAGTPNVVLHVGELAYGDRPFEVTGQDEHDVQLRTSSELFHKENILNEVIRRFPAGWKYGAYLDADMSFMRHDWALETIHQLQHHAWVQPFSSYSTLSAKHQSTSIRKSFAYTYIQNGYKVLNQQTVNGWPTVPGMSVGSVCSPKAVQPAPWVPVGATGGAWAFTQAAFNAVGGLLDPCILGHADWFMTFGLVAEPVPVMHNSKYHSNYTEAITSWQHKATQLKKNIGVVENFAVHHFHGSYANRAYETRDLILVKHQFDPLRDLARNAQGIYELTNNKPGLRDDIRKYFLSRNEDNPNE